MRKWWGGGSKNPNVKPSPMKIQDIEKLLEKRLNHSGSTVFLKIEDKDFAIMTKEDYMKMQAVFEMFAKLGNELNDNQDS